MAEGQLNIGDLAGIKPIGKSIQKVTEGAIEGAGAVLSRICLPAAEELGKLFQDKISEWRALNYIAATKRVERALVKNKVPAGCHAHPRLAYAIMEQASWAEDEVVQEMWAGLLCSSCTGTGDDDSNLIFMDLLKGLTRLQARVLNYACERAKKTVARSGLVLAENLDVPLQELCGVAGETDIQRLDRELDRLRGLSLLEPFETGLNPDDTSVVILTPSALALHMYIRCQGSRQSPAEFFQLTPA